MTINDQDVDLFLWDTAGQEQFHALAPVYAHSASAAVLVASVTDAASFPGLQYWLDLVNKACEKIPPMVLLVNKMDRAADGVISQEEVKVKYSGLFQGIFFVSAFTGEGLDPAFDLIGRLAFGFSSGTANVAKRLDDDPSDGKLCC
jgi:GTPase SAR1 family protein